jgi:8-oxo-dGTP diphosphatase
MTQTASRRLVTISTLVTIREGRMLLVRKEGATSYILPGGKIEPGESLEHAVRREVKEELGSEIVDLAYAASFQDEAADAPGVDVLVHVHVGRLASAPVIQAEIREIVWCDMMRPQVPGAPSLERQIFAYFQGAARSDAALAAAVRDLLKHVQIGEYSDRHVFESAIQAGAALGEISPDEIPDQRIFMPMRSRHSMNLAKKRRELAQIESSIENDRRSDEDLPTLRERDRETMSRYRQNQIDKRAQLSRDVATGEDVARRLAEDPRSLLLPLGTVVRTRDPQILSGDWPMPVGGTTGVVVGYSALFNRPNVVSFAHDVKETDGGKVLFDPEEANRFHQVNYLPEELDVLSQGELVDGTPVDRPGWWPTHFHHERGSILYNESMVVRSAGRLWRIQPCSLLPECTQITTDTDEGRSSFDHLKPLA